MAASAASASQRVTPVTPCHLRVTCVSPRDPVSPLCHFVSPPPRTTVDRCELLSFERVTPCRPRVAPCRPRVAPCRPRVTPCHPVSPRVACVSTRVACLSPRVTVSPRGLVFYCLGQHETTVDRGSTVVYFIFGTTIPGSSENKI